MDSLLCSFRFSIDVNQDLPILTVTIKAVVAQHHTLQIVGQFMIVVVLAILVVTIRIKVVILKLHLHGMYMIHIQIKIKLIINKLNI